MQTTGLLPRYQITVDDFHKMGRAEIFGEDDRIELIEGELIEMSPIGSLHAGTVTQLSQLLSAAVANRAIVYVQNPILLGQYSEPEPDICLLRPRADFYKHSLPGPEDVLLVIEVSDTTVRYDREVKIPLYARHGIPEAWLIDLEKRQLEVYLNPGSDGYRQILLPENRDLISPVLLSEITISIADLGLQ